MRSFFAIWVWLLVRFLTSCVIISYDGLLLHLIGDLESYINLSSSFIAYSTVYRTVFWYVWIMSNKLLTYLSTACLFHEVICRESRINPRRFQPEADLGIFSMFGRTGPPQKGAPTGQRLSNASFRMQKAVSPLSIQITAAILRTVHMYLPNVFEH